MSSDSSEPSKHGISKTRPSAKGRMKPGSDESNVKETIKRLRMAEKNAPSPAQPKVTVLEQLNLKSTIPVGTYQEEPHRGTATTLDSTTPTVITAVLRDLRDDIVKIPDYRQPGPVALVNGERTIAVIGVDNVYVQNKTKFIPVPREKALSTSNFLPSSGSKSDGYSPLDIAVLVQKIFTPLSSMCFGLLGGVALLQLILVHHLIGKGTDQEYSFFLQSYSLFAQIAPLLFYILLAVCFVSILDRVTVHQNNLVFHPSWIVAGIYLLTLIVSLSCASYDDMITLYRQNKTLFQDKLDTAEFVNEWQLLNSTRCLLALIGWILFSITSPDDLLLRHLLGLRQNEENSSSSQNVMANPLH